MKSLSALLVFFISLNSFSQEQSGYYITNANQRIEGHFKTGNFDDASSLLFKKSVDNEFGSLNVNEVQEYGIGTEYKYQKHTVMIDKSESNNIDLMTGTKDPLLEAETVFLNVLVEGEASLYSYNDNSSIKYFFRVKDKQPDIVPLIYKKYSPSNKGILENNAYRQQLFNTLNCAVEKPERYSRIDYGKKSLTNFFIAQNSCLGSKYVVYANKTGNKAEMKYSVFGGGYLTKFGIDGGGNSGSTSNGTSFGIGGEVAMVTASKKWELFGRVEFEMLSAEASYVTETTFNLRTATYDLDARVINVFLGPRYNFIANDKGKFFIEASAGICIPFGEVAMSTIIETNSGLEYEGEKATYDATSTLFGNFGIGYLFKEKLGVTLRYETNRNLFDGTAVAMSTKLSRVGLEVKYRFN